MGKDTRSKLLREVGREITKPGAVEERDEIRPRTVTMSERQWLALQEIALERKRNRQEKANVSAMIREAIEAFLAKRQRSRRLT